MFRKMRRFKQLLSDDECVEILKNEPRGVLALLGDDDYPYTVPLDFYYENGKIYFHCAPVGHKIDAIKKHGKASFCVMDEGYRREGEWALNIKSVIAFGKIRVLDAEDERIEGILRNLGLKYYPTSEEVEEEINKFRGKFPCCLELTVEHMTGKLVNES